MPRTASRPQTNAAPDPVPEVSPAPAGKPGVGHNRPPPETPEEIVARLSADLASLVNRQQEILAGIARFKEAYPTIPDAAVMARAADFAGQKGVIQKWLAQAKRDHGTAKDPFLRGGQAVDGFFNRLRDAVEAGQKEIRRRMTAYVETVEAEERERRRREAEAAAERARQAAEAAATTLAPDALEDAARAADAADKATAAAEVKPADLTRVHGEFGGVASLRERWTFEVSDLLLLLHSVIAGDVPIDYVQVNETRVRQAVVSEKVRDVPGLRIFPVRSV